MSKMIHPLSDVASNNIGDNSYVWQYSIVLAGAVIGNNCNINSHCFIENDVIIGNSVTIKTCVQIWDGLRIGNNVFVGPNVTFTNNPIPRSKVHLDKHPLTKIKDYASIGANATILVGITVGEYAMIGAGSVVTKSVPPYTIWYGNPARHKGYITKDSEILDLNLVEKKTGKQFTLSGDQPVSYTDIISNQNI